MFKTPLTKRFPESLRLSRTVGGNRGCRTSPDRGDNCAIVGIKTYKRRFHAASMQHREIPSVRPDRPMNAIHAQVAGPFIGPWARRSPKGTQVRRVSPDLALMLVAHSLPEVV